MSAQEDMLRQTLAKVRDHVEPSSDLLGDIRVAVARAERRRRLVAICVSVAVLLATLLALFILVTIRAAGSDDTSAPQSMTAVATTPHLLGGTFDGEHRHA
jgi:hypothetical protein